MRLRKVIEALDLGDRARRLTERWEWWHAETRDKEIAGRTDCPARDFFVPVFRCPHGRNQEQRKQPVAPVARGIEVVRVPPSPPLREAPEHDREDLGLL